MPSLQAAGTIKVKNKNGKLVPFMPATDASCVTDFRGETLKTRLDRLNLKLADGQMPDAFEIVHSEPTEENTPLMPPETLMAWYKSPETDGEKHLSVVVSNDSVGKVVKVGDTVTFTYAITNDGGE